MTNSRHEQPFDGAGMYGQRARYDDSIHHWKPYEQEANRLRELLGQHGIDDGSSILEAARLVRHWPTTPPPPPSLQGVSP